MIIHSRVHLDGSLRERFPKSEDYPPVIGTLRMKCSTAQEVINPMDYEFEKIFGIIHWEYCDKFGMEDCDHLSDYFGYWGHGYRGLASQH